MPHDAWNTANQNKIARHLGRQNENRRSHQHARNAAKKAKHVTESRLASIDTKLWFGKHAGHTIRDLLTSDRGYLLWLANQPASQNAWRMNILRSFLRSCLDLEPDAT